MVSFVKAKSYFTKNKANTELKHFRELTASSSGSVNLRGLGKYPSTMRSGTIATTKNGKAKE